jgi:hypothetical protein
LAHTTDANWVVGRVSAAGRRRPHRHLRYAHGAIMRLNLVLLMTVSLRTRSVRLSRPG